MSEIILKIEEVYDIGVDSGSKYPSGDGFKITTTEQEIKFLVSNGQSCCEDWGQLFMNDNPLDFIGAELLNIETVSEALNKEKVDNLGSLDCGDIAFLNINTSKGVLQLAVYDSHNGYYGHTAYIRSNQLNKEVF